MRLNKEQRIDIILTACSRSSRIYIYEIIVTACSGSSRMAAKRIKKKNMERTSNTTLWQNLLETMEKKVTEIITDQARCRRSRTVSDEGTTSKILAALIQSPTKSVRLLSAESYIGKSSISRILKTNKWFPHKLHMAQYMSVDDTD